MWHFPAKLKFLERELPVMMLFFFVRHVTSNVQSILYLFQYCLMPPFILNNNIFWIIVNYFILIIVILFEECEVVILCFQSVTFSRLESALRIDWSSPNCQQKLKRTPSTFFIMQGIVLTITKGIYYNTHKLSPARLMISKQLVVEDVAFLTQLFFRCFYQHYLFVTDQQNVAFPWSYSTSELHLFRSCLCHFLLAVPQNFIKLDTKILLCLCVD